MTKNYVKTISWIILGLAVILAITSVACASGSGEIDSSVPNVVGKSGVTISFDPINISLNQSSIENLTILLDTAPQGISGFKLNVELTNPKSARIIHAVTSNWAVLNKTTEVPSDSVTLEGIDLLNKVHPGEKGIILGTITIQGIKSGTTTIRLSNFKISDAKGNIINPSISEGKIIIRSEGNPINWIAPTSKLKDHQPIVSPLPTVPSRHN